jgi:hypothetical protein
MGAEVPNAGGIPLPAWTDHEDNTTTTVEDADNTTTTVHHDNLKNDTAPDRDAHQLARPATRTATVTTAGEINTRDR